MTTATLSQTEAYRLDLIRQLVQHSPQQIRDNVGGWATDRLDAIASLEWDLCEAGEEFTPFNLVLWEGGLQTWAEEEKPWMLED